MKPTRRTPLALALAAAFSAPAVMAADADTESAQQIDSQNIVGVENTNDAHLTDGALNGASGNIGVNVTAGEVNQQANNTSVASDAGTQSQASVARIQTMTSLGLDHDGTENMAHMHGEVLQDASGNIGVNVSAGNANQQSNDLAVATQAGEAGLTAQAEVAYAQSLTGIETAPTGTVNDAQLSGAVLQGASGNIGVNASAGNANQQGNGVAVATAETADTTIAGSGAVPQVLQGNFLSTGEDVVNDADVKGSVLQGASGNVGLNVTAGQGNQQGNGLAMAVSDAGLAGAVAGTAQFASANLAVTPAGTPNTASLSGDVLRGASGNIGVNISAGSGNQQVNNTAIAQAQ